MPKEGYRTITIPESMYKIIKDIVRNRPELGYSNISEFVREAVRDKLKKLGYIKEY